MSHEHSHSHHHSSHTSYSQPSGYGVSSGSHKKKRRKKGFPSSNKKRKMKKSNKIKLIIAIIICILILLAIAGYEIYNTLILPRFVQPVLKDVVSVMQDENYINGITKEIQRLYEIGEISGPEIEQYLEIHNNSGNAETQATTVPEGPVVQQGNETASDSLGRNTVQVKEENSINSSGSVNYYSSQSKHNKKTDNTVSMSELQTLSSDQLYAKAKSIMSAEDFATAMAIRPKLDTSKIKQLRSDSTALIEYVRSVLTADEYSDMLYIYAKYSNHLTN